MIRQKWKGKGDVGGQEEMGQKAKAEIVSRGYSATHQWGMKIIMLSPQSTRLLVLTGIGWCTVSSWPLRNKLCWQAEWQLCLQLPEVKKHQVLIAVHQKIKGALKKVRFTCRSAQQSQQRQRVCTLGEQFLTVSRKMERHTLWHCTSASCLAPHQWKVGH